MLPEAENREMTSAHAGIVPVVCNTEGEEKALVEQ